MLNLFHRLRWTSNFTGIVRPGAARLVATTFLLSALLVPTANLTRAQSPQPKSVPEGGLLGRSAIVANSATNTTYAVESELGTIAVIDGGTQTVSHVKVGNGPVAIAINSVTNKVYVINHESGTVSVLDGKSNLVIATVNVGRLPYVVAVDSAADKIYVSNVYSNVLTIIDGATNGTTQVKAVSADALAIDTKRNRVVLMGYEDSSLTMLDASDGTFARVPVGMTHLWGIALDTRRSVLYVTRVGKGDVVALDENSNAWVAIPTGRCPSAVALNSESGRVYIANYEDASVTVIDPKQHKVIATVSVGEHPEALIVDEKANLIYVANTLGNSVTAINGITNTVAATLDAGRNPYALALNAQGRDLYVANIGEPSFTHIDTQGVRDKRTPKLSSVD